MKGKSIYRCFLKVAMVVSVVMCINTIYGSNVIDTDLDFKKEYQELRDIQIQLSSNIEKIYDNKINNRSNEKSKKLLDYGIRQIDSMISRLKQEEESIKSDKKASTKIQMLMSADNILKYMAESIKDYIGAEGSVEQLQLLKDYYQLEGVLGRLLNDV